MPDVRLYNSLTKKIEPFSPREPGKASLYHCGPTVYQRQHVGNWRRFLFADFLRRALELFNYQVFEVTNITDVGHLTQDDVDAGEDKVAKAARTAHVTPQTIADEQTKLFLSDAEQLNIQPSHVYPRASAHIQEMQALIARLLERRHAYQRPSGVYFSVQSFPAYGRLSGNTLDHLQAGKRVAIHKDKQHPADFALWVVDAAALQRWPSPWGEGYPGWHIECSTMSLKYLSHPIDIHTGGEDNRFPHHENEIAQSEAAGYAPFVGLWLHNRHLQVGGQKMAKRGGQQLTLDTLAQRGFSPLAFRLLVFSTHYRHKLDFTWESLQEMQTHVTSLANLLRRLEKGGEGRGEVDKNVMSNFSDALADDLNTAAALAVVLAYVRASNAALDAGASPAQIATVQATLAEIDRVVGVLGPLSTALARATVPDSVQALVQKREQARADHDFAKADRLREQVAAQGYIVEDTPQGPRLSKK